MLPVLILCASFISPALLEDVVNKNDTLKSTTEVEEEISTSPLPVNVQTRRTENSGSKPHVSHSLRMNSNIGSENLSTSGCPQTDILLKILNLLTNSLPSNVEPQKFKNVVSDINLLLRKVPVNPAHIGLHNTFKTLQDELEKILNEGKGNTISHEPNENQLRSKISLEYDAHDKCEEVLNFIINFLNNAIFRNCLVRGKCLVNNLPQIQHRIAEQAKLPPLCNQIVQKSQSNNPYSQPNNLLDQYNTYLPRLKQETKEDNTYDVINLLNNYKSNSPKPANALENLIKLMYESQVSSGINKPVQSLTNTYPKFLIDTNSKSPEVNNMPWQYMYSALNIPMTGSNIDQESNIIAEKLRSSISGKTPNNSEGNISNEILNLSGNLVVPKLNMVVQSADNPSNVGNEMIASNILINPYHKLPTDSTDIQNLLTLKDTSYQPSLDYSSLSFLNPAIQNSYNPSTNNEINDLLILKYLQQRQILANKLAEAYPQYMNNYEYVRPDNFYVTPDKNKQHAQLSNLIQSGVSNSVKLNEVSARNGVVELTYMLKQPKPTIEPLYYAKYKMPYNTFLYNLQDILNKKPYLRQNPKQLYQELLLKSNITDVSDELKNLQQDELTKLVSTNGTLVAAKVIQDNKEISENLSNVLQTLNSTPLPNSSDNQLSITAARLLNSPQYSAPKPLIDIQKRLGLNLEHSYLPYRYSIQSPYQTNVNYNSGTKVDPNYSTLYGVPLVKYAYLLKNNVAPVKIQNYLQPYLSESSKVVKSN